MRSASVVARARRRQREERGTAGFEAGLSAGVCFFGLRGAMTEHRIHRCQVSVKLVFGCGLWVGPLGIFLRAMGEVD